MIFVDSNVPMYLVGTAHPHKDAARRLLESAVAQGTKLVSSAEVLQEILHRYVAIDRRDAIQPTWDTLMGVVDEVFPVEAQDVERARALVLAHPPLSARDALHVAVMRRYGVTRIMSFDRGFDTLPGIVRVA